MTLNSYFNSMFPCSLQCSSGAVLERAYAWKDPTNGQWERVRVTHTNPSTRSCRIFLLDVGRVCEVSVGDLRELQPRYLTEIARGFRAHLIDVKPVDGETWSQESIDSKYTNIVLVYFCVANV